MDFLQALFNVEPLPESPNVTAVVVVGSIFTSKRIYGPFPCIAEASIWGSTHIEGQYWEVYPLHKPERQAQKVDSKIERKNMNCEVCNGAIADEFVSVTLATETFVAPTETDVLSAHCICSVCPDCAPSIPDLLKRYAEKRPELFEVKKPEPPDLADLIVKTLKEASAPGNSTWGDAWPQAHDGLFGDYAEDVAATIRKTLNEA